MLLERISVIWLRARALVHRRRLDRDLEEELSFHMAMRAESSGPAAAARQFGNATRIREACRELWTFAALESFWKDVRFGLRTLAKAPAFSAVAIISLALGIGANTALFSLMDIMLLKTLPVKNPQQLVEFARLHPDGSQMTNLPYAVYSSFERDARVVADVFAVTGSDVVLRAGGAGEQATAHRVSGSFFPALGVHALMGRTIGPDDNPRSAAGRVAVLSHGFWSRRFGGDPATLGAIVRLDGEPYTVIGVMPPDFFGVDRSRVPDLWIPLAPESPEDSAWVLGHLQPGISISQAHAALDPIFHLALESMSGAYKEEPEPVRNAFLAEKLVINPATRGTSGLRWEYWDYAYTLKVLIGLSALVLAIACANLANLLMARTANRAREIGIRLAIGAGRLRLVRQLLTENLLLALAGGLVGLLVAAWGHRLLLGFMVADPRSVALDFRLDYRVLAFGLALSVVTAMLFGLIPAVRSTRATRIELRRPAKMPLARLLLAVQVGLSLVLLVGAGLFARSLRNLGTADLGLAREDLLLMDVGLSCKTPAKCGPIAAQLTRRVSSLPGVRGMALAGDAVFGNGGWNRTLWIERPRQPALYVHVSDNLVGPGFFATVGIPVLMGREFGEQDRESTPPVALVNQTFARRFFAHESPIGKRFRDSARTYEIVGVVGDAKYGSVREKTQAMVFNPILQDPPGNSFVLHVRTAAAPGSLAPTIVRQILAADGDALVTGVRTLPQVVRGQLREDRMFASLASFFALMALALGAIGIYGVVAYGVAHRTAEIGVRMALGAQPKDVLWLIMQETLVLLAAGAIIGVPASLAAGRLVRSLLFSLQPWDAATMAGALVTLFAAGALAGYLPARRAASIEPTAALRME